MRAALLLLLSACVTAGAHEATLQKLREAHARDERACIDSAAEKAAELASAQRWLDEATAQDEQLRRELARLGRDADKLLGERGVLATALDDARKRLDELRRAEATARANAALFRDLAMKLQRMIDAGELKIALRHGRMVLQLANDVMFDSGRVELKPNGQAALRSIASVLKTVTGRRFQVAGHTDTVPISTARFPSNWELSTARAVEVVRFLIAEGLQPTALSAAGYGEFDPAASNESATDRQRNRRTEIMLQPNIDELISVPEQRQPTAIGSR